MDVVDTAKLLRAALKNNFPGVNFGVRCQKYAGGASIQVRWEDGPETEQVKLIAFLYKGAELNGDYVDPVASIVGTKDGSVQEVRYGADHISLCRFGAMEWEKFEERERLVEARQVFVKPDPFDLPF